MPWALAGDVNGDGYSDIIVGAPLLDPAGVADAGRAYVYYGAVGGLSSSPNWTVDGAAAGNRLGAAVGTAGDTDGDGYADVVIGVYGSDSLAGQILLYQGSSGGLGLARTIAGEAAADRLGLAVGAAGDVNGDGFGDIIAGAPGFDNLAGANAGRATVYHGSAGGPGGNWGPQGRVARAAGDVNGDGYSDVIVYDWPLVSVAHMAEVLTPGRASAALAASIFHFGEIRIADAKAELLRRGVEVRPPSREVGRRRPGGGGPLMPIVDASRGASS